MLKNICEQENLKLVERGVSLEEKRLFLDPLRSYLKTIEQIKTPLRKLKDKEISKLCLSKDPIAVLNIWETLIEAQNNTEFVKFMLTQGRTEEDFRGNITGWQIYKHERPLIVKQKLLDNKEIVETFDREIYIPETKTSINGRLVETLGKLNPYKSFKTSHSTVARTMRNIESLDLEFVYSIALTYPKEVSKMFLEKPDPDKIILRLDKCFKDFVEYLSNLLGGKIGLAVNPHTWSSMNPLSPHAHAHLLLLDRLIMKDNTEKQIIPSWFMKYNERTKRFEQGSLTKILKHSWALIVNSNFNYAFNLNLNYQELDVNVEFIELKKKDGSENVRGKRKLIHKLKYNRRRPISDLALFYLFNEFDVKAVDNEFAEHLLNYKNRTKIFGYWNRMSKYAKLDKTVIGEKEARCPFCCEKLVYVSFHEGKELPKNVRKVFVDRKASVWLVSGVG